MLALLLGVGLLASADAPAPPAAAIGGGRHAEAEWEARQGWRKRAEALVRELDEQDKPGQDAESPKSRPVTAPETRLWLPPVPQLVDFRPLLEFDTSHAQALIHAIALRDARMVAEAAQEIERLILADEAAVAALLMMEIA